MQDLVLVKRYTSFRDVYALDLMSDHGVSYPITKRYERGHYPDGSEWSDNYYDVTLPHDIYVKDDDVKTLLEVVELNGFSVMNPFGIVIKSW